MKVKHMQIAEAVSARLTPKESEQIEKLIEMGYYLNTSDFIRAAVREKLALTQVIMIRPMDLKSAKREIVEYLKKKPTAYPSEMAMNLGIDLNVAMRAVEELKKEGKVKE